MNEFEKSISSAKRNIFSILEGERGKEYETNLEAIAYIAARCQSTSKAAKRKQPLNRKERAEFNQQIKAEEEISLKVWAKENDLWINDRTIQNISKQYIEEGAEQKVYLKNDGKFVIKINTGIFHGTWLEFFIRL